MDTGDIGKFHTSLSHTSLTPEWKQEGLFLMSHDDYMDFRTINTWSPTK